MRANDWKAQGAGLLICMSAAAAAAQAPAAAPAGAEPAPPLPEQLQDFDAYVEAVRKQFEVPGIAVAIVQEGRIVLERGYGLREIGKPEPVDAHTLFAIASNTKAFTAASLSMLADEAS